VNVFLAALTTVLIAIFAAAFAAPYVVDWNDYRTVFETQASRLAGRPVRVEGDVNLTLLPVPEIRFRDVSIANAEGGFDRPAAHARTFRMALSLPPLLRGRIEARTIELDKLSVRLGADVNGDLAWPQLGEVTARLPFVPANVSLKAVTLNDAALTVERPDGSARWRIEGLDGRLSAESLRGPFKFTGYAPLGGKRREVQFSAGRMSEDGTIPVKAYAADGRAIYRAEGALSETDGRPVFAGQVGAADPLPDDAPPDVLPRWRASAKARITLDGAALEQLEITANRAKRPQTLTGRAEFSWSVTPRLEGELSAGWLDLGLLAGEQLGGEAPADVLLRLPALLGRVPVPAERARVTLTVGQISLGGELIRDVSAVARRTPDGWGVEKLEAQLPGSSDLDFEGRFTRRDGEAILAGTIWTSGRDLGRLLSWARPEAFDADGGAATSFSLKARVESGSGSFALTGISTRLGDSRLAGHVKLTRGPERSASFDLKARRLDLRPYVGSGGTVAFFRRLLREHGVEKILSQADGGTVRLALKADDLVLPEIDAHDVNIVLRASSDAVVVETLSLHGREGLRLTASGRHPFAESSETPRLRAVLAARDAEAVRRAAALIPGAERSLILKAARLREAMPLRLTATLRPSAADDSLLLRIDGTAAQSSLLANARFFPGGRFHFALEGRNPHLSAMIRQAAPELAEWLSPGRLAGAARLSADFTGASLARWDGQVRLETDSVSASYDGAVDRSGDDVMLDGELALSADRTGQLASLLGLSLPPGSAEDGRVRATAAVKKTGGVYHAREMAVTFDEPAATGTARLDLTGARPVAEVVVSASRFNLGRAANLLLRRSGTTAETDAREFWPDRPFASDALKSVDGALSVKAGTLVISEGLSIRDAVLSVRLAEGAVAMPELSGRLAGGALSASARLDPARGRMVLSGDLEISGVDLASLPHGSGEPLGEGRASLTLRAKSEGITPRGLVAVMSGEGRVTLTAGTIRGLDPKVLALVARQYLQAEEEPEEQVAAVLRPKLRQSVFSHNGAQAAIRLEDGALRVQGTRLGGSGEAEWIETRTRLDLTRMHLRSNWDLGATLMDAETLPRVRVSFTGPMWRFGELTPDLDTAAYQQFLTVSRLERNVERLERLERGGAPEDRPKRPDSVPSQGLTAATPSGETDYGDDDAVTAPADPDSPASAAVLPGFSTRIEEAPGEALSGETADSGPGTRSPDARGAAETSAADPAKPEARPEDPQVVEDARRDLMRRPPPETETSRPDRFFEIFRN